MLFPEKCRHHSIADNRRVFVDSILTPHYNVLEAWEWVSYLLCVCLPPHYRQGVRVQSFLHSFANL